MAESLSRSACGESLSKQLAAAASSIQEDPFVAGLSRAIAVHPPADVFAGMALGGGSLWALRNAVRSVLFPARAFHLADALLTAGIEAAPEDDSKDLHIDRMLARLELDDPDRALVDATFLSTHPKTKGEAQSHNFVAYCHLRRKDYRAVVAPARESLRLDAEHWWADNNLGIALFHLGNEDEAFIHLDKAMAAGATYKPDPPLTDHPRFLALEKRHALAKAPR
ncbi:MAG: hypothetical protein JST00_34325 [Deltaproteobacteria bacterium]|nr:hypothetical protein [Deltaproteobacteria bacterium]